jgi:outer membrane protein OmpA-like peptidoglycan-associated protein
MKLGYIFAMRLSRQVVLAGVWAFALASVRLCADPGDVESSHDYHGIPRIPGFTISDYDEDAPATFDFPVARPLPTDSSHIEKIHVKGHRYAIRYELAPGSPATAVYDTQKYYEKLAADAGFTVEKSGAVGDVTESFYKAVGSGSVWFYVEPGVTANIVTIVESNVGVAPPLDAVAAVPHRSLDLADPGPMPLDDGPAIPATLPDSPVPALPTEQSHDQIYESLNEEGRVVVPFVFKPGKDTLDESSQALVDRVAAMMKAHPELLLRIEGHTDNSGEASSNMRLSAERALAIKEKLVDAQVEKKRLDAVGVGGLQPLADNDTAEGREKNRRIELVVWKKGPAYHEPESENVADSSPAPAPTPAKKIRDIPVVASDSPIKVPVFRDVPDNDDSSSSRDDSSATAINTTPTFHASAPNGHNYYPNPGGG